MTRASIPLESAYLCLDCDAVGNDSRQCPACASGTVASLSGFLNRCGEQDGALQAQECGTHAGD